MPLPDRDVRRKRPPFLSFLLRLETLRRVARVVSLLVLDFIGVVGALFTALMLKLAVHDQLERRRGVAGHQALDPVRLPGHRAAVRAGRPVRRPHAPARTGPDRHRAVPGDGDRAGVRARRRPALLELLHLLRLAVLRDDLHRRAPRAAPARQRLAARAGRIRAARGAGRVRQAHRGGRAGAGRPVAHAGRHRRLHLSDASPAERPALARRAARSADVLEIEARAGGDHRRPRLPPGQGGRARRHVPPARRDGPGGALDDGDPDRSGRVRARPHGPAVHAAPAGVRGRRLRGQADLRPGRLLRRPDPALAGPAGDRGGGQAELAGPVDLPLGPPGHGRQAVPLLQVPHDARARRRRPRTSSSRSTSSRARCSRSATIRA